MSSTPLPSPFQHAYLFDNIDPSSSIPLLPTPNSRDLLKHHSINLNSVPTKGLPPMSSVRFHLNNNNSGLPCSLSRPAAPSAPSAPFPSSPFSLIISTIDTMNHHENSGNTSNNHVLHSTLSRDEKQTAKNTISCTSSPSNSPPTNTPASPSDHSDGARDVRQRAKQLKSRCTCCHVCRTSLKNYPREHLDCTQCNAVVCKQCIENRLSGLTWGGAMECKDTWLCPACDGTCVCQRCNFKPTETIKATPISNKRKRDDSDILYFSIHKVQWHLSCIEKGSNSSRDLLVDVDDDQKSLEEKLQQCDIFICEFERFLTSMRKHKRNLEAQIVALQHSEKESGL